MKNTLKKIEKLQLIRNNKNISYKNMAEMLGVSKTYYWQIENGKRRITYEFAKRIASIFNLKPDDIFYEEIKECIKKITPKSD